MTQQSNSTKTACTNPTLVNQETDVIAYTDGEGRPTFVEHLKECQFCRDQVAEFELLQAGLEKSFKPPTAQARRYCPPVQRLTDYAFGLLDGSARVEVADHLQSCAYCPAEYAVLEASLTEPALEPLTQVSRPGRAASLLRAVVATLLPPTGQPLASLRGAGSDEPQEYRIEDVTLVLQTGPVDGKSGFVSLNGLLMRPAVSLVGVEVRLMAGQDERASEILDDTGSFLFETSWQPGDPSFSLEIKFTDKVVEVPDIYLG